MNSIIIIISCVIVVTLQQQQQCSIGQLSFDQKKCIYAQMSSIDTTFFDALSDCKQRATNVGISNDRASLVSISSAFDNANVLSIASNQVPCNEYYIGLNNIGNILQWSDGSNYSYSNWDSGCPTVYINESDRCVTINSNGQWCNRDCAIRYCYICEIILSNSTTTTTMALTTRTTTTTIPTSNIDCFDWRLNGSTSNGIYQINPGYGLAQFDVYCDMTTDGGGWTVIQRRVDDSLEFWNNTWQQYKNGFNDGMTRNLWLGNDRIHVMSSRSNVILRVEINGDRSTDNTNPNAHNNTNPNIYLYGKYNFSISDEMNNYTLQISLPIEGNASNTDLDNGFHYNNGMPFSTGDKGSIAGGSSCAIIYQAGGWWFNYCTYVALNGKYNATPLDGFKWYSSATGNIFPNRSEMKIRRQ